MIYEDMFQMMGNTPLARVHSPEAGDAEIYVKLEGSNPTGSIKDRACVYLIRDMESRAELRPGKVLLDSSSGNMACAIAYYGRILGYKSTLVANSKLTEDKRAFITYHGAELLQIGDFTIEGNHHCRAMKEAEPERYCFLDQLHNWANPRAHYETTGPEILSDFPDLAMVVGSLGSGGTMTGTSQYMREHAPNVKTVVVQSATGTKIPGTGAFDDGDYITPFIAKAMDENYFDHIYKVQIENASRRTLELRDQGIFCGIQTGGVLDATLSMVKELGIKGKVVMMSGDSGWKNMEKLALL